MGLSNKFSRQAIGFVCVFKRKNDIKEKDKTALEFYSFRRNGGLIVRVFRTAVCVVFAAVTVLFGFLYVKDKLSTDLSVPVIKVDSEISEVSVNITDSGLLEGVTAYDEKDGDITDKIIIESVSKFTDYGLCKVTYAVCDSDNHVATASKKIKYTDYTSPKFYSKEPLCFADNVSIDLSDKIGVTDCIDGDISDNLILTTENLTPRTEGTYSVKATVTNSRGDTAELDIPIIVEEKNSNAPIIELSDYIVYTPKNKKVNIKSYIKGVTDKNGNEIDAEVKVDFEPNYSKSGVYKADFYTENADGYEGHTFMIVVVGSDGDE